MISKNLQRGIAAFDKEHPQYLFHILFIRKFLSPITPHAIMSPKNLSISYNVTFQLLFPVAQCTSIIVHFWIFLSMGSLKKMRNKKRGLRVMMRDVKYVIRPAQILTIFCCCSRPAMTSEGTKRRQ